MKTMQKLMAIIAALTMTVSMATICAVATDDGVDEPETEIEFLLEEDNKEPDSSVNCDKPILEIDEDEEC